MRAQRLFIYSGAFCMGVPVIQIILYWVLYLDPLILRNSKLSCNL